MKEAKTKQTPDQDKNKLIYWGRGETGKAGTGRIDKKKSVWKIML